MTLNVLKMIEVAKNEVADKEAAKKLNASDFQNALDVIKEEAGGCFSYKIRQPYPDDPDMKFFDLTCSAAEFYGNYPTFECRPDGTVSAHLDSMRGSSDTFETVEDALGWIVRKLADSHIFNKSAPCGTHPS